MTTSGKSLCLFAVLAGLLTSGCATPWSTAGIRNTLKNQKELLGYRCTVGAHRGESELFLENSTEAIHAACSDPHYAFVEFDVQYSKDKRIVVFHDGNLLRLFGRLHSIKNCTSEELGRLSANQIASYEQVMDLAVGKPLNIEIKSQGNPAEDEQLIDYVINDVKQRHIENCVLISSVSEEAVAYTKRQYPEIAVGQVFFLNGATYLPFDFLTEKLYQSPADYLMFYTANLHNLNDLLKYKPENKTLVFWEFSNSMYIVHKDLSDRLWGDTGLNPFTDRTGDKISWHQLAN